MLAALCVVLVAAADILFYRAPLGWTPAPFAAYPGDDPGENGHDDSKQPSDHDPSTTAGP